MTDSYSSSAFEDPVMSQRTKGEGGGSEGAFSRTFPGGAVWVHPNAVAACHAVAHRMDALLRNFRPSPASPRLVLGLSTGNSPIPVYQELVRLHRENGLSFQNATSYNLDEYYPIHACDPQSYHFFMYRHLFSHIDIPPHYAHVLDGSVPLTVVSDHAKEFERWIDQDGGLDFQLLGVGRNGHIGFNEPANVTADEALATPTRLVDLHPITRADAQRDFGGVLEDVPVRALTVGMAPILRARELAVLAYGASKAKAVRDALLGPLTAMLPASLLRTASEKVTWHLDPAAAELLLND